VVAGNPDRFTGFAYRDPFASETAEEPRGWWSTWSSEVDAVGTGAAQEPF
jgi:hypothetical protein